MRLGFGTRSLRQVRKDHHRQGEERTWCKAEAPELLSTNRAAKGASYASYLKLPNSVGLLLLSCGRSRPSNHSFTLRGTPCCNRLAGSRPETLGMAPFIVSIYKYMVENMWTIHAIVSSICTLQPAVYTL